MYQTSGTSCNGTQSRVSIPSPPIDEFSTRLAYAFGSTFVESGTRAFLFPREASHQSALGEREQESACRLELYRWLFPLTWPVKYNFPNDALTGDLHGLKLACKYMHWHVSASCQRDLGLQPARCRWARMRRSCAWRPRSKGRALFRTPERLHEGPRAPGSCIRGWPGNPPFASVGVSHVAAMFVQKLSSMPYIHGIRTLPRRTSAASTST
eukprot:jgi/Botrbrau1/23009/Bobra.136_1s0001.1